jgi:hypothetical protein
MVLQLLVSFGYSLVENSWMAATVLVKYFLIGGVGYTLYRKQDYFENFRNVIEDYSGEAVSAIVLIGFIFTLTGFQVQPIGTVLSHIAAVSYFGYLFWEF